MEKAKKNNGIRHTSALRERAVILRKAGKTHREIRSDLGISVGSAYLWTKGTVISKEQKMAIEERRNANAFPIERRQRLMELARVNLARYREKHTKESLLEKLADFYKKVGRIPLKREFNMYNEYKRQFGSWNNAIRLAGFDPNPVLFAKKFVAKDGHKCDSFTERIIDDWLHRRGIIHERGVRYGKTKMTGDFFIAPNIVVEFFGLAGVQKKYDAMIKLKRKKAAECGWRLIEIYPRDVFEKRKLGELLRLA